MVVGLRLTISLGAWRLKVTSDSQLIVNQVNGECVAWNSKMASYLALVNSLRSEFKSCKVSQALRESNSHADAQANLGSSINSNWKRTIPVGYLEKPCIDLIVDLLINPPSDSSASLPGDSPASSICSLLLRLVNHVDDPPSSVTSKRANFLRTNKKLRSYELGVQGTSS